MFAIGQDELSIILIVSAFVMPIVSQKVFTKKMEGPKGAEWRLKVGFSQLLVVIMLFFWAKGHSPYNGSFSTWRLTEFYYLAIVGWAIVYGLYGVFNIAIGILTAASNKKAS